MLFSLSSLCSFSSSSSSSSFVSCFLLRPLLVLLWPGERTFDYGFSLGLLAKDVETGMSMLDANEVRAPVLRAVREMVQAARVELGDDVDHLEMVKLLERWGGAELSGLPLDDEGHHTAGGR